MIASTSATMADDATVSSSAETARRLEMAVQNVSRPPSSDFATTAAKGNMTMSESQATAAPPEAADPHGTRRTAGLSPAVGAVRASLGSGNPQILLDLRHGAARRVEELVVDLAPAAEVVDREQRLRRRELLGVDEALRHRPVAVLGVDLLRLVGVQPREELGGLRLGVLGHGRRVLDEDRLVGDDVVDVLAL